MPQLRDIESAILDSLRSEGPCNMDDLVRKLPSFTWNQIFSVLDGMSRQGKLLIQAKRRFVYEVSLPQHFESVNRGDGNQGRYAVPAA